MDQGEKAFATPQIEKRRYRRTALLAEVRCASAGQESILLTRDISAGGTFISAPDPFPAESEVRIGLLLSPGKAALDLAGKVVHSLPGIGMGIEFQGLDAIAVETLQKFVDEAL